MVKPRVSQYNTVVVSNKLTTAEWGLEVNSYRVITAFLNKLVIEDRESLKDYISINIVQYAASFGISQSTAYRDFKNILEAIMKKQISFKEGDTTVIWNYVRSIRYSEKGGYSLEVLFEENLLNYLIPDRSIGRYTKLKTLKGKHYTNFYATILYRVVKEHTYKGKVELGLEELKEYLGVAPEEYKLFGHFNARILKPAVKEINSITDIFLKYEKGNEGKSVESILFTMGTKEWAEKYRT